MNKEIIYDSDKYSSKDVVDLSAKGIEFLCPICQSSLAVITSEEMSSEYKRPHGIFCLLNDNHVWIKFIFAQERQQFWDKFEENLREIEENAE